MSGATKHDDLFGACSTPLEIIERNFEIQREMYETQVAVKNQLIKNLEDIIEEQEGRIYGMEGYIQGRTKTLPSPKKRMLKGIAVLSVDFGSLSEENLELKEALRKTQKHNRELELYLMQRGSRPRFPGVLINGTPICLNIPIGVDNCTQTEDLLDVTSGEDSPPPEPTETKVQRTIIPQDYVSIDNQKEAITRKFDQMRLMQLHCSLKNAKDGQADLAATAKDYFKAVERNFCALQCQMQQLVTGFVSTLIIRYRKEVETRKRLHNQLVELKGNIRVLCRVRPTLTADNDSISNPDQLAVFHFDPIDDGKLTLVNGQSGRKVQLSCDKAFRPSHQQCDGKVKKVRSGTQVFDEIRPLILSCIDGFNVCIFAYGQTGSGKTHTMEGPDHDPGVYKRALNELFNAVKERGADWNHSITISMLEIYNEQLRDLLLDSKTAQKLLPSETNNNMLQIRLSEHGKLYVPGLTETEVANAVESATILALGKRNRATAATNMNERSSRSHAIVRVTVEGANKVTGQKTHARLNLVDLAGSERVSQSKATGVQLKQAQHINRSLSELGNVVSALRNRQPHVPFRNSLLTRLLEDCLNGDSKTLVIVQLAPGQAYAQESASSLAFAEKIAKVELGQASANTGGCKPGENGYVKSEQQRSSDELGNTFQHHHQQQQQQHHHQQQHQQQQHQQGQQPQPPPHHSASSASLTNGTRQTTAPINRPANKFVRFNSVRMPKSKQLGPSSPTS